MFTGNSTNVDYENKATLNCVHLLLSSELGELFGDPEFGVRLKRYTFKQNNYILKDILIDEIYSQLVSFCPQLIVERKNIEITKERGKVYVTIYCKNRIDYTTNTYNLVLFEDEEKE